MGNISEAQISMNIGRHFILYLKKKNKCKRWLHIVFHILATGTEMMEIRALRNQITVRFIYMISFLFPSEEHFSAALEMNEQHIIVYSVIMLQ